MAVDTAHELPLATLVRRLDPSSLARRMVTEFSTQIPAYGRLPDPDAAGGILEMSRRNLELFIECVVADRSPTREELEPFCRSARQRASEGMPLEDLLAAYRMGGRLGWREMSASAQPGEQDALIELAERTMHYVDRVSAAVAQSYLDARQHHVSEEERRGVIEYSPYYGKYEERQDRESAREILGKKTEAAQREADAGGGVGGWLGGVLGGGRSPTTGRKNQGMGDMIGKELQRSISRTVATTIKNIIIKSITGGRR